MKINCNQLGYRMWHLGSLAMGQDINLVGEYHPYFINTIMQILHIIKNIASLFWALNYRAQTTLSTLWCINCYTQKNQLKVISTGLVQTWSIFYSFLIREFLTYTEKVQLYKNICAAIQLLYLQHPERHMYEWGQRNSNNKIIEIIQ